MELANWFHDASVEECLQCSDGVPPPPNGWSCHFNGFHGGVFSADGGYVDLPNGGSGLAMEQRQGVAHWDSQGGLFLGSG